MLHNSNFIICIPNFKFHYCCSWLKSGCSFMSFQYIFSLFLLMKFSFLYVNCVCVCVSFFSSYFTFFPCHSVHHLGWEKMISDLCSKKRKLHSVAVLYFLLCLSLFILMYMLSYFPTFFPSHILYIIYMY